MIQSTNETQLRRCLDAATFPANRDDLLTAAVENRCDVNTIEALGAIEPGTYTNIRQVLAAASIVDIPGDDIALRDRSHRHDADDTPR